MSLQIPVNFQLQLTQNNPGGYPYQIKASDLQKNFVYCALDASPGLVENFTGPGGHTARRLKIPSPPATGTHVLASVGGTLQWLATEEC